MHRRINIICIQSVGRVRVILQKEKVIRYQPPTNAPTFLVFITHFLFALIYLCVFFLWLCLLYFKILFVLISHSFSYLFKNLGRKEFSTLQVFHVNFNCWCNIRNEKWQKCVSNENIKSVILLLKKFLDLLMFVCTELSQIWINNE